MQGLTVCVGYDDLLDLCLAFNAKNFTRLIVVTDTRDKRTAKVVAKYPNAELFRTDAFYAKGAAFNKGAAIEEASLLLDPNEWVISFDADIVFPREIYFPFTLDKDTLYGPLRYDVPNKAAFDKAVFTHQFTVVHLKILGDEEFPGYFALYHPQAKALESRPWFSTNWRHAGGYDTEFQNKFEKKERLLFRVLHLGATGVNWHGRSTQRWDNGTIIQAEKARQLQEEMYAKRRAVCGKIHKSEKL